MIAVALVIIVAVLLLGLLFKLLKVAIIIALAVGIVMFAQNKLGRNGGSERLK